MLRTRYALSVRTALLATLVSTAGTPLLHATIEIEPNDFRISFMSGTGDPDFDATFPAVAFNPSANEYLVVWAGQYTPLTCFTPPGEDPPVKREIFGQFIDGETGELVGSPFRISLMGGMCNDSLAASHPAVAYNDLDGEYLAVWSGNGDGGLAAPEFEIFGQRLDAGGAPLGEDDFRISEMGGTGDAAWGAFSPEIVFNDTDGRYLVVWSGDHDADQQADDEFEIFGQLLDRSGEPVGVSDFRISDVGTPGDPDVDAVSPRLAHNSVDNEYLVVWPTLGPSSPGVLGQRLNENGTAQGADDFVIRSTGRSPSVTHNADENEYLVASMARPEAMPDNWEISIRRLSASGSPLGGETFISDMGGIGETPDFAGLDPDVTYSSVDREYVVVWWGDDNAGELSHLEYEIFGQRLSPKGVEVDVNDFRISDMGGTGDNPFDAEVPRVVANPLLGEYLVVWHGDDDVGGLVDGELEIFGQRLGPRCSIFADGFESGDLSAW